MSRTDHDTKPTSRARAIADARQQEADERYVCLTCSGVAQEHSDYCIHCEMYWQDGEEFGCE